MLSAAFHGLGSVEDFDWCVAVGLGAVAELTGVVPSPGPHGAVVFDGEAMAIAGRHGFDVVHYLDGLGTLGGGAVAELSVVVHAHCPEGAVVLEYEDVEESGLDVAELSGCLCLEGGDGQQCNQQGDELFVHYFGGLVISGVMEKGKIRSGV